MFFFDKIQFSKKVLLLLNESRIIFFQIFKKFSFEIIKMSAEIKKNKEEAQIKIENGEWIVKKKEGKHIKSEGWSKFGEVYDKAYNQYAGFVRCFSCGLLKVFQRGGSPKWLANHSCPSTQIASPSVTSSFRTKFKDACVDLCAGDMRPFSTFSGPFFQNMVQVAVDAGAQCGAFDAAAIISDASTISRSVAARAQDGREKLMCILKDEIRSGRVSATTDLWTDSYSKRHYITLNVHYINCLWEMKKFILFTKSFPDKEETGENIFLCLQENFKAIEVSSEMLRKITFVTDGGANLVKALSLGRAERLYCAAHCLNIVLKTTFAMKLIDVDLFGECGQNVIEIAQICSLSAKRLDKILKNDLKDRSYAKTEQSRHYHSSMPMLESLLKHFSLVR